MKIVTACLLAVAWVALAVPSLAEEKTISYHDTKRIDHVDNYHGTRVADPYRWLEDDVRTSQEVAAWVEAQNKVTFGYLESIPERQAIRRRLTELWDYEKYSSFWQRAGRYFFYKNNGLQNQSVLYTMDKLDGEPRVLIDPNQWTADGTAALSGTTVSDDGRLLAFGRAEGGSDWKTWRVLEIDSGKLLDDEIRWTKFTDIAWSHDNKGFYYGRYDEPQDGQAFQSLNLNQKLFYHQLGTPQSEDVLIHQRPDQPTWGFSPHVSEDGRYLIITVWKGTDDRYRILVKDLTKQGGKPQTLIDNFDHEYTFIGNDGARLFFKTDLDAPRRRVIAIDLTRPQPQHYQEIIAQADETLRGVSLVGNRFIASYLTDAKSEIKVFKLDGQHSSRIELPSIGTASGFGGRQGDKETFYEFSSFASPTSIYRYDLTSGRSTLVRQANVKFQPDAYRVRQIFYRSKDGTRVPMFLVHSKHIVRDGNNPTLLYGYGGFNIPITPYFSVSRLQWMEMGGVVAIANLRGGGEYGQAWHKAGTKLNKQNVFDDFIAAAEWLIEQRYTRPAKLAIQGRSNGGLLVGAVMTQRPDLCAAALPGVGVMDMLRFHKFTAGRFWVDDYGSADNPREFPALLAYSPYHNLKPGTQYPATLVTTADTDDRVVPGHSFKFASRLQHVQDGPAPVLIRIETSAGHGAGTPTSKLIEQISDEWAFLVRNLDMDVSLGNEQAQKE